MTQLSIETLTDGSARQFGQYPFTRQDTYAIRRVLSTTERRCRLLSQPPCAREVGMQVAVRSAVLTKHSSREEKRAIARFCSTALGQRDEARRGRNRPEARGQLPQFVAGSGLDGWGRLGRLWRA